MPKKIKHVSELPEWFKIEKYAFTNILDARGWYEQLSLRGICLYQMVDRVNNTIRITPGLKSAIQSLRENP